MDTIRFNVADQRISWDAENGNGVVEKTRGFLHADFTFDQDWDDTKIVTLWQNSEIDMEAIPIAWNGEPILIPEQVLAENGRMLVSCVGTKMVGDQIYRITTYEMRPGIKIHRAGPLIGVIPEPITPGMIEQLMAAAARADTAAENANNTAQDILDRANNGEFDGTDGIDGYSPTIHVHVIPNGHKVTITDVNGVKIFPVYNGKDGTDGQDGYSPSLEVSSTPDGHEVSITDAAGTRSFQVDNGKDGANGKDGKDANVVHVEGEVLVFEHAVDLSAALADMDTVIGGA